MNQTEPEATRANRGGETTARHAESTRPDAAVEPGGSAVPRVEPQMPHERDESSSSQASASEQHAVVGKQAYADTVGPTVDTDRGPVVDTLYNDAVAKRPDVPPRE